jgi:hypothetical protein
MQSLAVMLALVVAAQLGAAEALFGWDGYLRIHNEYPEWMILSHHTEYHMDWHGALPLTIAPGEYADFNVGYSKVDGDSAFDLYFDLGDCTQGQCSWSCNDDKNPNGACMHVHAQIDKDRCSYAACIHATAWLKPELDNNGNVYPFDAYGKHDGDLLVTDLHIMPYKTDFVNSAVWVNIASGASGTFAYQS